VIAIAALAGSKTIKFGATVSLVDEDTEDKVTYQIVGQDESDIKKGLLSITSPLGRALIGKEVKNSVEINTPGGTKVYEVTKILYK
jgi:transcription elongation factor GreA